MNVKGFISPIESIYGWDKGGTGKLLRVNKRSIMGCPQNKEGVGRRDEP
jgi:hypothetical protein